MAKGLARMAMAPVTAQKMPIYKEEVFEGSSAAGKPASRCSLGPDKMSYC